MLIALYFFLSSLFGGVDSLEARVQEAASDPARRASAVQVVQRIEAIEDSLGDQVRATSDALRRLHSRHDATREDYLAALKPLEVARKSAARALLAARADLRGILTRDEWEQVFPSRRR